MVIGVSSPTLSTAKHKSEYDFPLQLLRFFCCQLRYENCALCYLHNSAVVYHYPSLIKQFIRGLKFQDPQDSYGYAHDISQLSSK